ncbi:hypothetical protein FOA52_012660 [Chlamydomonas sp. UWO 241]|nr:hypothetical protein FOA52_012660 [Chlamydomonas sp. UWO 241]
MSAIASRSMARPPEKGVFPLDHFGECKQISQDYLKCLENHDGNPQGCMELARVYLNCRMDKNLMAKQEMHELGMEEAPTPAAPPLAAAAAAATDAAAAEPGGQK